MTKVTILQLLEMKRKGEKISMVTAYDYSQAGLVEKAGIHAILVGDSLGMVVLGYPNTLAVTMDDMIHHCKAVSRGSQHALLIGDMPFLSYQTSQSDAVRNAGRFLQEAGMDAVKLEGGREQIPNIQAILAAGIPVMGHLGLTPQSIHQLGGFRPQARNAERAKRLFEDAVQLQQIGCFGIVLESIPAQLAAYVTDHLEIPTIGIGAGSGCSGQVLVTHDLLGLFERFTPKFAKKYAHFHQSMVEAFSSYMTDIETCSFPAEEHCVDMPEPEWQKFISTVNQE